MELRRARRMLARGLWRDVQRQRMFLNEAGKELGIKEVLNLCNILFCFTKITNALALGLVCREQTGCG